MVNRAKLLTQAIWRRTGWPAVAIVFVMANSIGVGLALKAQHSQSSENHKLVTAVANATIRIQNSRLKITRENCGAQNRRHYRSIGQLHSIYNQAPSKGLTAVQKTQARQGQMSITALITAIVPAQDCNALVKRARTPVPPKHTR